MKPSPSAYARVVIAEWKVVDFKERVVPAFEYDVLGWRPYSVSVTHGEYSGVSRGEELIARMKSTGREVVLDRREDYAGYSDD